MQNTDIKVILLCGWVILLLSYFVRGVRTLIKGKFYFKITAMHAFTFITIIQIVLTLKTETQFFSLYRFYDESEKYVETD